MRLIYEERVISKEIIEFNEEDLDGAEKEIISDFNKMKLLETFEVRNITKSEFNSALDILDSELGKKRVRSNVSLREKFNQYPQFFIGVFLGGDLIGVVCGFPREDYLLISELAVDGKFQRRGFGKLLVEEFEKKARGYKIKAGAQDGTIDFYKSLLYKPFLLVQFNEGDYFPEDFNGFKINKSNEEFLEINEENVSLERLEELRKRFPKAYFQYIFTKKVD
ncbi:MAG: GNAT family N-acetyltransferase [Candidatus Pacearchaeota archaeon]